MNHKRRDNKDRFLKVITYVSSFISVFILGAILCFIFSKGLKLLNWDIITGDNTSETYILKSADEEDYSTYSFEVPALKDDQYFSTRFGIILEDSKSLEGHPLVVVAYVSQDSPLKALVNSATDSIKSIEVADQFSTAGFVVTDEGLKVPFFLNDGAEKIANLFDTSVSISSFPVSTAGGGIRGSIIATLYLVVITLVIALPIGISTSLYLHEIAPENKLVEAIRSLVDMLTGIPSIVYGLMGAAFFIPLTMSLFGSNTIQGGSILSGSLTLAVIVLPVIIKATDTALDTVPKEYKEASLALGANITQTTFKVMLPNAIPGILSAALLSIGRIIGESAALIYAIGTAVKDDITVTGKATSLAVHIWSVMAGETPNIELSATISIIILFVVLSLNLIVKLMTHRFTKRFS